MPLLLDSIVAAFDLRVDVPHVPTVEESNAVAVTMSTLALANHLAPRILHLRRDRQSHSVSHRSAWQAVAALVNPARAVGVMKHDDDPVDEKPLAHGLNTVLILLSHVPATAFLDRLSIQIHDSDKQQIQRICSLLNQRCQHLSVLSVYSADSTPIFLPTMCRLRNLFLYGPVSSSLLTESLAQSPAISLSHLDLSSSAPITVGDFVAALSSPAANQLRTLYLNCPSFHALDANDTDMAPSVFDALNRKRLESLTVARLGSEQAGLAASLVRFLRSNPERLHTLLFLFCVDAFLQILLRTAEKNSDGSQYMFNSLQCLTVTGTLARLELPITVFSAFPNLVALKLEHRISIAPSTPEHSDSCLILPRLRFMTIEDSHIGGDEAIMSRLLSNNLFQLETLDLCSSARLTGAICSRFLTARNCPHLRELSLRQCRGLASDLHLWTSPPPLVALDLYDTAIPSIDAAAAFLVPLAAALQRLRISFDPRRFTFALQKRTEAVLKLLNDCSRLEQLSLDGLTVGGLLKSVFTCSSAHARSAEHSSTSLQRLAAFVGGLVKGIVSSFSTATDSGSSDNNSNKCEFKLVKLKYLAVDYDRFNDDDFDIISQCCVSLEEVSNVDNSFCPHTCFVYAPNDSPSSLTHRGFRFLLERCLLLKSIVLRLSKSEEHDWNYHQLVGRLRSSCVAYHIVYRW